MSYFKINLYYVVTCIPRCCWNCFCLEKSRDGLVIGQNDCRFFLLPTKCVRTREMPCKLPKTLLTIWTSWAAQGRTFPIRTPQARTFCALIEFSGQRYLRSLELNQHFWSLPLSSGLAVSVVLVVPMPVHKHHRVLYLLNQRRPSVLLFYWLVVLLWAIWKMAKLFGYPGDLFFAIDLNTR